MVKRLFLFCVMFAFICPAASAQKAVIGAFTKRAEELGVKAAEKDLLELEKRLGKLTNFRSCKDLQKVSALLLKRVPESPQRDELNQLFRSGQYARAQALVHTWRTGETLPFKENAAAKNVSSRKNLSQQFVQFNLYNGAELKKAVALLNNAVQERLLTKNEYRNILWSLSRLDFSTAGNILARSDKASHYQNISTVQHEKNLTVLSKMYEWNDLHPATMLLPASGEVARREAIRRVMGSIYGGKRQPLEFYKTHYDKLLPWQQQEVNRRIEQMEKTLSSRLTQQSEKKKQANSKASFGQTFKVFAEGNAFLPWRVINVLYSPYVSAGARRQAEQAFKESVPAAEKYRAGVALYEHYASNLAKGVKAGGEPHAQVLNALEELKTYLLKNRQWPPEETALFAKLKTLQDNPDLPGARLVLMRLKQQQQCLPEKGLYKRLLEYISVHGKFPPSSSSLYSTSRCYRRMPGPYREKFEELFQKYHRNKPK